MAVIILRERWLKTPTVRMVVNLSNPLAYGLMDLWRYDLGFYAAGLMGKTPVTEATNMVCSGNSVAAGIARSGTAASGYIDLSHKSAGNFTLISAYQLSSLATYGSLLDQDAISARIFQFRSNYLSGIPCFIYFNTTVTPFTATAGGTGVGYAPAVAIARKNGNTITVDSNMALGSPVTMTGTPRTIGTTTRAFQRQYIESGNPFQGIQHFNAIWSRALTDGEVKELRKAPWQLFKSEPRRLYIDLGEAPTTISGYWGINAQVA